VCPHLHARVSIVCVVRVSPISLFPSADSPSALLPPLALLSFPTRRSSDLHAVVARRVRLHVRDQECVVCRPGNVAVQPTRAPLRSEEHTSELQSPDQLVCRLLLEKKKPSAISAVCYSVT